MDQDLDQVTEFRVDITPEDYIKLPWTIQLLAQSAEYDGSRWECHELDVTHCNPMEFSSLCVSACKTQLALAKSTGKPPALPIGLRWGTDHKPERSK